MHRTLYLSLVVLSFLLQVPAAAQSPALSIEVEGGPAWQSYNDVEIPNEGTASRFSLVDLAGNGPWPAGRVYVTWNIADNHGLRALLAPFSLTETGVPDAPLLFANENYAPGQPAQATYTFNSYRLSYRYRLHRASHTTAWVGFTAKVRDAVIALEQDATSGRKDDLGFVPLLHLAGEWRFTPGWHIGVDVDALAGGPGRAIDAALKVGYHLDDRWRIQGGYRIVEGGADVPEVYAFAWLHYGVISLQWSWRDHKRPLIRSRVPGSFFTTSEVPRKECIRGVFVPHGSIERQPWIHVRG